MKRTVFLLAAIAATLCLRAQRPVATPFAAYLGTAPQPAATMDATREAFPQVSTDDRRFSEGYTRIQEAADALRRGFHERFLQQLPKAKTGSGSPEERRMMEQYRGGAAGLGEEGRLSVFSTLMELRPLAATQKLSWQKPAAPLPARAQEWYRGALALEQELRWPAFYDEITRNSPAKNWFQKDDAVLALNASFAKKMDALPKKKVKAVEGSDVLVEMTDPAAMIRLVKDNEAERRALSQKAYAARYRWWRAEFDRVQGIARRLDSLLEAVGDGAQLAGAEASVLPVLADVQLRVWEMLHYLHVAAGALVDRAQIEAAALQQAEQTISVYEQMNKS